MKVICRGAKTCPMPSACNHGAAHEIGDIECVLGTCSVTGKKENAKEGEKMNRYNEENAAIAAMKTEAETEATCQACGQITTLDMLQNGVHYGANLCQMFRQGR